MCVAALGIAQGQSVVPLGTKPLPVDRRGCDPVFDDSRYLQSTGTPSDAHSVHGAACLDEGRYFEAIPELEQAVRLQASARNLVALGVAYDGAGRFHQARVSWQRAERVFATQPGGSRIDFAKPVGLEPEILAHRYREALMKLEVYFTPKNEDGGRSAPFNGITFDDLGLTQPFLDALHVAANGNAARAAAAITALYPKATSFGEIRYARAIMLLALGRRDEARFELRLASRLNSVYSSDFGPYPFQWSALRLLAALEPASKRDR